MGSMICKANEERILARCFPKGGSCFGDEESDAGLCYKRCNAGYDGVGPVCWQQCDNSMVKCGAACAKTDAECAMAVAGQVVAPLIGKSGKMHVISDVWITYEYNAYFLAIYSYIFSLTSPLYV